MLRRKMLDYLNGWRANKRQECLLIKGARQVGKSFIVDVFGKQAYASYVPIDFIKRPELKAVFEGALDAGEIYRQMSLLIPGLRLVEGETLIFLDEIQECPAARTALKYLAQDGRYDVVASGSLLGISFKEGATSVPVGYERQIEMHPLDFEEYLWACGYGEESLAELRGYLERMEPVPRAVHEQMMRRVREYVAVGGMPAVVEAFVKNESYAAAHDMQLMVLAAYRDDIARYATSPERVRAQECYASLPRQLAKENTKFQYSVVEKGGSARKFESSIDWLDGARTVLRCRGVDSPQFPLLAYESTDKFRLYASDTGLLMAMYGFEMKAAVVNNTLAGPMKGGLYENLVAGMLAKNGVPLRYWMSQNGAQEIEFLAEREASVLPIEVKASRNASASLDRFLERPDVKLGYKLGDYNVGRSGKKVTLPLYMAPWLLRD